MVMMPPNRMQFQRDYYNKAPRGLQASGLPYILNIGCAEDPCQFRDQAMHFDMDDWSRRHKYFTQGDAEDMHMFSDCAFHTVIMGDVIEHIVHPKKAIAEACRVCASILVLSIFEEWRVGPPGLHIAEGQRQGDIGAQKQGFADGLDWQTKRYPDKVTVDNVEHPHLFHIWTFTDDDVKKFVKQIHKAGFRTIENRKEPESIADGHQWYNWLLAFERVTGPEGT